MTTITVTSVSTTTESFITTSVATSLVLESIGTVSANGTVLLTTAFYPSQLSTCTSTAIATDCPSSGGLSSAATGGIAVATTAAGALIGILVFWLLMKNKRKNSRSKRTTGEFSRSFSGRSAPYRDAEDGREKPAPITNLDYVLPQPLDDQSVVDEVGKLFSLIDDHVDSDYYHDRRTQNAFAGVNYGAALPAAAKVLKDHAITLLLDDERTRFITMKAAIAAELLAAISFYTATTKSLLPEMVTSFLNNPSPELQDNHSELNSLWSAYELTVEGTHLCISRWRTSTALLLGSRLSDRDLAHRDSVIDFLVQSLDLILSPFENHQQAEARKKSLIAVCKRAEKLGLVLLSQPAEWEFNWRHRPRTAERTSDGRPPRKPVKDTPIAYFPGLVKVTDNSAMQLEAPRMVLKPRVKG
jgi:hypothetical protein